MIQRLAMCEVTLTQIWLFIVYLGRLSFDNTILTRMLSTPSAKNLHLHLPCRRIIHTYSRTIQRSGSSYEIQTLSILSVPFYVLTLKQWSSSDLDLTIIVYLGSLSLKTQILNRMLSTPSAKTFNPNQAEGVFKDQVLSLYDIPNLLVPFKAWQLDAFCHRP